MRCRTTVTINATAARPTLAQNSGQICHTTAIAPAMNAIRPMVEPAQAARVRPWCTCLPRRLVLRCVTSDCCAVLAMVPSFPLIGICIPSTYRPGLLLGPALLPVGVLHCVACCAFVHIGVWHLGRVAIICGRIDPGIHCLPQFGWIVGSRNFCVARSGLESIGSGWPGPCSDHGQCGTNSDQHPRNGKDPGPDCRVYLERICEAHLTHLGADGVGTGLAPESAHCGDRDADQQQQRADYAAPAGPQCQHQQRPGQRDDGKGLAQPPGSLVSAEPDDDAFAGGPPPRLRGADHRHRTTDDQAAEGQRPTPHPAASAPANASELAGWTAVKLSATEIARTTAAA